MPDFSQYGNNLNFDSPINDNATDFIRNHCIQQNLKLVSTGEIKKFCNRVNFYLEHFSIIGKKTECSINTQRVSFLKELKGLLQSEINSRAGSTAL